MSEFNKSLNTAEELKGRRFVGSVVDITDPLKIGRCKVRVFGLFDDLEVEDIPWAVPRQKSAIFGKAGKAGSISIPKIGALISVEFNEGDIYTPEYFDIMELADDLRSDLSKEGEYENSHYLIHDGDESLKVYFTKEKGLTLILKGSRVNIAQDNSITIEHEGSQSIIELVGGTIRVTSDSQINMTAGSQIRATANQAWVDGNYTRIGHSSVTGPAVLGDKLFSLLSIMAGVIDSKMPATPGFTANLIEAFKAVALSNTVIIGK